MRTITLGCEKDHISVRVRDVNKSGVKTFKIKNEAELIECLDKIGHSEEQDVVMCSSSLDFPHEYTKDKSIIEVCRKIRG